MLPPVGLPPGVVLHAARRAPRPAAAAGGGGRTPPPPSLWSALLPAARRERHATLAFVARNGGAFTTVLLGHGCISHHLVSGYLDALVVAARSAGLLRGGHGGAGSRLAVGLRDLLARSRLADDELAEQA